MKRFTTINNLNMIQCGDYNWEILVETDNTEVYRIHLSNKDNPDIIVQYQCSDNNLVLREANAVYYGGVAFFFKMDFKDTPAFIKSLLEGEDATLMPIYRKDSVKIKNNGKDKKIQNKSSY